MMVDGNLLVAGTSGNDTITVNLKGLTFTVTMTTRDSSGQAYTYVNNTITVPDMITLNKTSVIIYGNDGNDNLSVTGDTFLSVLVGGAGSDTLTVGQKEHAVLIGGTTTLSDAALAGVAQTWAKNNYKLTTDEALVKNSIADVGGDTFNASNNASNPCWAFGKAPGTDTYIYFNPNKDLQSFVL
jgi:hypothetical protein